MKRNHIARRAALAALLAAAATPFALRAGAAFAASTRHVSIGWQKGGSLAVIKGRGALDKALAANGIGVDWLEFPSGPVLLEALNAGSVDFGLVGETPPVFAQAAGTDLVYVGNDPPAPRGEELLVPKGSSVRTVADLRGKRIALNKGSNVHYLLVKLLQKAGLRYGDVDVAFLAPADARAAFERGSIDGWVIWDPYGAAAEAQIGARVLANGTGVANNFIFFVATRRYAERNGDVLALLLRQINSEEQWIAGHIDEAAAVIAPQIGVSNGIAEVTLTRYAYGVVPVTDAVARQQQEIADTFYALNLIPRKIDVADAIWRPEQLGRKS